MYGADHDVNRFTPEAVVELRPETPIKNFYLTGQDIFTCGFAGAAFGGNVDKVLFQYIYIYIYIFNILHAKMLDIELRQHLHVLG